jgi:hypothetical protein
MKTELSEGTKSPECWSTDRQARGLRVQLSPNHSFVLPFEHFIYSELEANEENDTLKIVFATHEVILRGNLLYRLEQRMQKMELAFVAAVPGKYHSLVTEGEPVIREIAVIAPHATEQD